MLLGQKKTLNAIVDAKAAARQDSASSKQKKVDAVAQNTLLGTVQVSQGKGRCGLGSKATSFGDAVRADEVAMVNALANSVPAGTRGGRSSPLTAGNSGSSGATSSGRSSPLTAGSSSSSGALSSDRSTPAAADGTVSIPALGDELAKEMGAPSIADLARDTGATNEQAGRFLKTGFTYDLLPRGKATAMMTRVLKQKLFLNRGDKDVEDYIAEGKDFDEHDFEVPGLDGLLLKKLCHHYGMDEDDFYSCDDAFGYANGWHVDCQASSAKFDVQTERLANLLIPGPVGTPPAPSSSNASGAAPADSIINLGPSRRGNRGKKSRNNSNKLREEGLEG